MINDSETLYENINPVNENEYIEGLKELVKRIKENTNNEN